MRLFVPGRVCLFGEHSDWAGGYRRVNSEIEKGYTLICGTDQGIYAAVEAHPDSLVLSAILPDGACYGPTKIPMQMQELLAIARQEGFWSYIAGVAFQVLSRYSVGGLVIENDKTDLPVKKGLSSSASICVLTARAFNRIYDLKLSVREEMELAYLGEITTASRCGRMDQGCAFGKQPLLMTFDGDGLEVARLNAGMPLHLVIVDLEAEKDTVRILERLNQCFPNAASEIERGVQRLLGPINQGVVQQAVEALRQGDARRLGALMDEAQAQFDRYALPACPEELSAPVLHRVLSNEKIRSHIWGGKGIGSQGDGSVQFIARSQPDQQAVVDIIQKELKLSAIKLTISPSPVVRRAVITAAGYGTRLFPASKVIKKELFPIIDRDGVAKPALLLLVEEALEANLDEVIIVVGGDELQAFRDLFVREVSDEIYDRLPELQKQYANKILALGKSVRFIVQPTQEGLGHAVYCAREAVGDEPFLLLLGDHVYRGDTGISCTRQMLRAYAEHGTSILGLRRTRGAMVEYSGAVAGSWIVAGQKLDVRQVVEKPTVAFARECLQVAGLDDGEYLTLFGQYILTPAIFECLEDLIARDFRENDEIQLTSAIDHFRRQEGVIGLMVDGQSYDIGMPARYLETLREFGPGK